MAQYVKGFQRFHAGENVRAVTSCKFLLAIIPPFFQERISHFQIVIQSDHATFPLKCPLYFCFNIKQCFCN